MIDPYDHAFNKKDAKGSEIDGFCDEYADRLDEILRRVKADLCRARDEFEPLIGFDNAVEIESIAWGGRFD